ncbi:acetyltransferase, GNAT family [Geomicrobium sp. JCM 19037]|nr:acetyltransferase, GNAT family [Geomicrobium sp. JCM 19037]
MKMTPIHNEDENEVITFLLASTWPFHRSVSSSDEEYRKVFQSFYMNRNNQAFWIENDAEKVGLLVIEDINDDIPFIDMRLAERFRGQGLGKQCLHWATDYIFQLPQKKYRIEGHTKVANIAMRKTFHACGYVKEGYFRDAWENSDGSLEDCLCYAFIRRDWGKDTPTPLPVDELPF